MIGSQKREVHSYCFDQEVHAQALVTELFGIGVESDVKFKGRDGWYVEVDFSPYKEMSKNIMVHVISAFRAGVGARQLGRIKPSGRKGVAARRPLEPEPMIEEVYGVEVLDETP